MELLVKKPKESLKELTINDLQLTALYKLLDCQTVEMINVSPFKEERITMLVDENGKINDKKYNFEILHGGINKTVLVGNVVFCGIDENNQWTELNENQIKFICKNFKQKF